MRVVQWGCHCWDRWEEWSATLMGQAFDAAESMLPSLLYHRRAAQSHLGRVRSHGDPMVGRWTHLNGKVR